MSRLIVLLGSDLCANLLAALLHSLWQGLVIAALLLLYLRSKGAKDTNVRYIAGLIALTAIVLCGLFTWAILNYEPVPAGETRVTHPSPEQTASAVTVESGGRSDRIEPPAPERDSAARGLAGLNWRAWATCLWLVGVMVMLLRAVCLVVGGSRLPRQCKDLEDEHVLGLVEQLRKSLGIARRIRVAVGEHIVVPGVVGCIRPILLLPISMATGVPADDLRAILAHEMAHIRRYDYLANFCQMVIEAILFFNPAVWWISKQIRIEREACCDEAGVAVSGQRMRYAEVLTGWAERLRDAQVTVAAPAIGFGRPGDSGNMLERVRRIVVAGHRPRLRVSWYAAAITLILSLVLLVGLWRGTTMAVALAGKVLTPRERIEKMQEIAQTHDPQPREYGPQDRLQLSGTIRTADGSELPENTQFAIFGYRPRQSSSIHEPTPKDGKFSTSIEYFNKVVFVVSAPGYAPWISKPYELEPGDVISDVELVLDKGFAGRVRFVNKKGEPIAGTKLSGTYFMPTKDGWSGVQTIDEVVSADDGIAIIEHCIERPARMNARADGYQADDDRAIELKPGEVFVWELTDAEPTTGIVVARGTGQPIEGAELRLCHKDKNGHEWGYGGNSRIVLAETNDRGQFVLASLNKDWEYTFIVDAAGYNRTLLRRVRMGQEGLRVQMGPELHVRGRVIGDIDTLKTRGEKAIVAWESRYQNYSHTDDNGWAEVEITDGVGHFTIRNILGDLLILRAGSKTKRIEIADESIDDFVIDLGPEGQPREDTREVVLEFEVPDGAPLPEGQIRINSNSREEYANNIRGTSQMYQIENGRIRLEVPVPGRLSYDLNWDQSGRVAGYWIERKGGIEIPAGDGPFVVSVAAHPAGAIYGQVLEADGTLAKDVKLHLIVVKKAPVMEHAFLSEVFGWDERQAGKFNAGPLPLGGEYAIVAYRDSTFAASKPITLDEQNSIRQIEIQFVEGVTVSGRVLGPDSAGAPGFAGASVTLTASVGFDEGESWGSGAGKMTSGQDGRFVFEHVNPKLPGYYTLDINAGRGYQGVRMGLTPKEGRINIKLEAGYNLTGVLLDDATGWPIPGAQVWAAPVKKSGAAGNHPFADGKTDEDGRFQFSTMAKRAYRFYLPGADIVNSDEAGTVTGGQAEPVTLRVKLHEHSDLKPRRPADERN
jgi:beta-lactamase regulating signal transducer with metallopeptidase domain